MLTNIGYIVTGAAAGLINGLLGTGGGIVIIYALSRLDKNGCAKDHFATALTAILPVCVVSAGAYLSRGSFDIKDVYIYILPAAAGGLIGAFLLDKLKTSLVNKVFSFLLIFAGINMIFR